MVIVSIVVAIVAIRWQLHRTSEQYRADLAARVDVLPDKGRSGSTSLSRRPGAS
jgi:hypothetical protein